MKEIAKQANEWIQRGEEIVLATVVNTWGSGPRKAGSVMGITRSGKVAGSVSGGCVEGDVIREAETLFGTSKIKILQYGITNDDAWKAGLTCGGKLEVLLEPLFPFNQHFQEKLWREISQTIEKDRQGLISTRLNTSYHSKHLLQKNRKKAAKPFDAILNGIFGEQSTEVFEFDGDRWFAQALLPKPKLFVIGASHIAIDLVRIASAMDFYTKVIDPRGIFTDPERFDVQPDELIRKWPAEVLSKDLFDSQSFAVLLTHDPKIDDQALEILLSSEIRYIGALGSSRTHQARIERLSRKGYEMKDIARIHAPVGLDIGSSSPAEIGLSIMAQIIAIKNKKGSQ